jgi:phospholipid/cholesterol/gamma-HCH transport system substrate-binding protein
MREERREQGVKIRVGVFVLIALLAFFGTIYALGARARLFESRYTIHADFTEVGGLTEGATVRLAGVQIGRVSGVHLPGEPGGKVRVDLNIARRFADRIRKNSRARIDTQGLLGDKIIEVSVGTADAPAVREGETIPAQDPTDISAVINQSAATVKNVALLSETLRETAQAFQRTHIVEDIAASTTAARQATQQLSRIVDQAERGRGWAHALVYEEPAALRQLNDVVMKTQAMLERMERGEGAVGVLLSPRSTDAARKLVAAMERFGQAMDTPERGGGLLPALLLDPEYRAVLDDLRVVAHNLRDVSDRVAGGRGTLGSLVKDEPADQGLRGAMRDLEAAAANLKQITDRINEGEGTLGALIADPTIYERLAAILDGAQRSTILKFLLRRLGDHEGSAKPSAGGDKK